MIHLLWSIIFGFIVGALASHFYPSAGGHGFIFTTLVGVAGSFVGGWIAQLFSRPEPGAKVHPAGCVMSFVGALVVLFIYKKFLQ